LVLPYAFRVYTFIGEDNDHSTQTYFMKRLTLIVQVILLVVMFATCSKNSDTASSAPPANNPNNSSGSFYGNTAVARDLV
jgi:uncharacterized lipoprotein YajG